MIVIKKRQAIEKMTVAGKLLSEVFDSIAGYLTPGISTLELNNNLEKELQKRQLISQAKGYKGYKHATCISLNDEVVHGVPNAMKKIAEGTVVKVDICAAWSGYCADMARCYIAGQSSSNKEAEGLIAVAWNSLNAGIAQAVSGNRISDISAAVQAVVEAAGYGVVRDFAGHGIGKHMHEDPEVLNYGSPGQGPLIRPGMAFAIEPMITARHYDVTIDRDGWTVRTKDKSLAAHVEDTVIVTDNGPRIVTRAGGL